MDYEVINTYYSSNNTALGYDIKCKICGHTKYVKKYNFIHGTFNHNMTNCKNTYCLNNVGKIINDFEIVGFNGKTKKYLIRCSVCGVHGQVEIQTVQEWLKGMSPEHTTHGIPCIKFLPNDIYKRTLQYRYSNIQQRCNNPNNTNYHHYGGRGIKCGYKHFTDFYFDFIDEIRKIPESELGKITFDRIDVNGDYCRENLRLTTQSVQSTNTTRKKYFVVTNGIDIVLSDSCQEFGRKYNVNGGAIRNLVTGRSKTSQGWRLLQVAKSLQEIEEKSVTTKLIIT